MPPASMPERAQGALALFGVALLGDRLGVVACDLDQLGRGDHRTAHAPDAERQLQRARTPRARLLVRGEPVRHADVRLRFTGSAGGLGQAHAIAARDQLGDIVDARNPQAHAAHTRADGGNQIRLGGRAQDPHRALGRFFEGLEEHVRGALGHPVGVFDHHHPVAADARRVLARGDQLAHLLDRDQHALGAQHPQIRMRASRDLPFGRVFVARPGQQCGRERVRQRGASGPGRPGDQPGVREAVTGRGGAHDRNGIGLPDQVIPRHASSLGERR